MASTAGSSSSSCRGSDSGDLDQDLPASAFGLQRAERVVYALQGNAAIDDRFERPVLEPPREELQIATLRAHHDQAPLERAPAGESIEDEAPGARDRAHQDAATAERPSCRLRSEVSEDVEHDVHAAVEGRHDVALVVER